MGFLTRTPIDLSSLLSSVESPERGGSVVFVGSVRNHHDGRTVDWLDYSAYEPMAESASEAIVAEAVARWPVSVALAHRIGHLEVGDVAVAVVVAGDHRDEAFAACRYVIEEVKRRVPIWKRERYSDGTEVWVDPTASGSAGNPEAVAR